MEVGYSVSFSVSSLDAYHLEDHLWSGALLACGRVSHCRNLPYDRSVGELELEIRQQDRQDDLCEARQLRASMCAITTDDSLVSS